MNFDKLPNSYWRSICRRLEHRDGFRRTGAVITGVGETIHQSFERSGITLGAGWDTWSGNYLLSDSSAGDEFLQRLFHELDTSMLDYPVSNLRAPR